MAPNLTFCDIWDEWKVEEGKGRLKAGKREKGREVEEKGRRRMVFKLPTELKSS